MNPATLTEEEVRELTGGKTRPGWQARELDHLGIPYKRRSNGTLAVSRAAVEAVLGAPDTLPRPADPAAPEPRLRLA